MTHEHVYGGLGEVRAAIDVIDEQIVDLLAHRAAAVMAAIPYKAGQTYADARLRRDVVIEHVVALARQTSTPFGPEFEALVAELFTLLTDHSMRTQVSQGGLEYVE